MVARTGANNNPGQTIIVKLVRPATRFQRYRDIRWRDAKRRVGVRAEGVSVYDRSLAALLSDTGKRVAGDVVGVGAACLDCLASVEKYPQADDKVRSLSFKQEGGGNTANCLTALSRLLPKTLKTRIRLVSKVGEDSTGDAIVTELERDGIDCSLVLRGGETSAFTYIIVDEKAKTRTCIHTPLAQPVTDAEVNEILEGVDDLLAKASILVLDGRHAEASLAVAKCAKSRGIPILVDAEKPRPLLDQILKLADIVVAPESFVTGDEGSKRTREKYIRFAAELLPSAKLLVVTRGSEGSVALANPEPGGLVKDIKLADMKTTADRRRDDRLGSSPVMSHELSSLPVAVEESACCVRTGVLRDICVADTTGAGDAFIGTLAFTVAVAPSAPLASALELATVVSGISISSVGARSGLPRAEEFNYRYLLQVNLSAAERE